MSASVNALPGTSTRVAPFRAYSIAGMCDSGNGVRHRTSVSDAFGEWIFWTVLGASTWIVGLVVMVWIARARSSPARLVKVTRINGREGWIEVRFGKEDYARLVADLNAVQDK